MRWAADEFEGLCRSRVEVVPDRWIGGEAVSVPPDAELVVTLEEAAAPLAGPGVVEVRHVFRDSRWEPVPRMTVDAAVDAVLVADGPVLVRCRYGLNRSALVAGLALRRRGWRATEVVERLRTVRPGALTNPHFVDLLPGISRNSTRHYPGPCRERPGVHLAQTAPLVQDLRMRCSSGSKTSWTGGRPCAARRQLDGSASRCSRASPSQR
jgi:hypothetical protein